MDEGWQHGNPWWHKLRLGTGEGWEKTGIKLGWGREKARRRLGEHREALILGGLLRSPLSQIPGWGWYLILLLCRARASWYCWTQPFWKMDRTFLARFPKFSLNPGIKERTALFP